MFTSYRIWKKRNISGLAFAWKRGGELEEMMIFVISETVKIYTQISLIIH